MSGKDWAIGATWNIIERTLPIDSSVNVALKVTEIDPLIGENRISVLSEEA